MSFRQDGTSALGVAVGTHNTAGAVGPSGRVAIDWRINIVDDNQDAGKNSVIDGYINSSPVIAYTNTAGSRLKLARAASLLPQAAPALLESSTAYRWSRAPGAASYELSTQTCSGASGATGPTLTFGSTNTQYTVGPSGTCVSVKSVDHNGLSSDAGERWRLQGFSAPIQVIANGGLEPSSRHNGLVAFGKAIAILAKDNTVRVSVDGGTTFSTLLTLPTLSGELAFAGSTDATNAYFHLVYRESSGNTSSLRYVRGEKTAPNSGLGA